MKKFTQKSSLSLSFLYTTGIILCLYIFSEWLFLATMPTYLDRLGLLDKIIVLLIGVAVLETFLAAIFFLFSLIEVFFPKNKFSAIFQKSFTVIPVFILASLTLLLFDNFTYTMFGFGIITSAKFSRALYALGFLLIAAVLFKPVDRFRNNINERLKTGASTGSTIANALLFFLILSGVWAMISFGASKKSTITADVDMRTTRPNIFLLTADGLQSENMSVYGYSRTTTPFLDSISTKLMIMTRNHTNADHTSGSLVSIYTSKYPAETRVLYPPDILNDKHAYQHLPGILKSMGYYTAQYSLEYYADAYELNLREGFDESNGRHQKSAGPFSSFLPTNFAQFLNIVFERIISRLGHIFFLKEMNNPYAEVMNAPEVSQDFDKMESIINLIDKIEDPLFVHIHWHGTHGSKFYPRERVFSNNVDLDDQGDWNLDLYDDSIRDFDIAVQMLYQELERRNILDDSIIIIGSDHGIEWNTTVPIPLIFIFPQGEFSGRININSQNMDIAPTILDYMNVDIPLWMDGDSLLNELSPTRPIYTIKVRNLRRDPETKRWIHLESEPPFFHFGQVTVFVCNRWWQLNLNDFSWNEGVSALDSQACAGEAEINKQDVLNLIIEHFKRFGFETNTLTQVTTD